MPSGSFRETVMKPSTAAIALTCVVIASIALLVFSSAVERAIEAIDPFADEALTDQEPFTIAFISSMSGPSAHSSRIKLSGAEALVRDVNASGGVNGRPIALRVIEDGNDIDEAKRLAEEIGRGEDVIAVIGHGRSSTSFAAGSLYRLYGVPVVTPSATNPQVTQFNDWYFRTVFEDTLQSEVLANYIKRVLKLNRVAIVYVNDVYASTIRRTFMATAETIGLSVVDSFIIPARPTQADIDRIADALVADQSLDAVLLSMYSAQAEPLVAKLRELELEAELIGPDALAEAGIASGSTVPTHGGRRQHFTEGMYLSIPFIPDTASAKARAFLADFAREHGENATWEAVYAYDSLLVLVEALRRAGDGAIAGDVSERRRAVRDHLARMRTPATSESGLSGAIYFDHDGDARRTVYITQSRDGLLTASLKQYQPVAPLRGSHPRADAATLIEVDGILLQVSDVVYTGLDIYRIDNIDERASTFHATLNVWFRYSGDLDLSRIEFSNATQKIVLETPSIFRKARHENYESYRVEGDFRFVTTPSNLINGTENLSIRYHHAMLDQDRLTLVADGARMGLLDKGGLAERLRQQQVLSPETSWLIDGVTVFLDSIEQSTLGDPDYTSTRLPFSQFNTDIEVEKGKVSVRGFVESWTPALTCQASSGCDSLGRERCPGGGLDGAA